MGLLDRLRAVPGWVDARLQPIRATLPYQAWTRYSIVRGNVLAGGIAYFAFFSIFPALAVGFTVFAYVLGGAEELQAQVVQYINTSLGAPVISYHQGQNGIVSVDQLVQPRVLTVTGLVGLVTLVLSGLGWVGALRDGIQAVFAAREDTNVVVVKLRDLALLAASGLVVLASAVVSVAVSVASTQVLHLLGMTSTPVAVWTVNVVAQLLLVVVDTAVFTVLFHRLCGVSVPWADVAAGGLVAAVGFSVLKLFASQLLTATSRNRFLASFGLVVGLLVWMNLVARLILVAAAWSATVAQDRGHLHTPDPLTLVGSQRGAPEQERDPDLDAADDGARRGGTNPLLLVGGFVAGAATGALLRRRRDRPEAGDRADTDG